MADRSLPAETFSVREIALSLGISRDKVLRFVHSGDLCALNVGTGEIRPRWRISRESLDAFLATRATAMRRPTQKRPKSPVRDYFSA